MPLPLTIADFIKAGALGDAEFMLAADQTVDQVAQALQQEYLNLTSVDAQIIADMASQARQAAFMFGSEIGGLGIQSVNPPINPNGTQGYTTIDVEMYWDDPGDGSHHYQRTKINVRDGATIDDALKEVNDWEQGWIDEYDLSGKGVVPEMQIIGITTGPGS